MQTLLKSIALYAGILFFQNSFANIGVASFPAQSFQQANPVLTEMLQAQQMAQARANLSFNKIMIFGGINHDVYLGCLNCSDIAPDSVHNTLSPYGSSISNNSIFNTIGMYGSKISTLSACNLIASNPPVIVDNHGNYYGKLTLNLALFDGIKTPQVVSWLRNVVCN